MSDINPKGPLSQKEVFSKEKGPQETPLNETESRTDNLSRERIGQPFETDSKKLDILVDLPSPSPEIREKFEKEAIAAKAIESIEGEKERDHTPAKSIHDNWANEVFEDILLDRDEKAIDRVFLGRKKIKENKQIYAALLDASPETPMQREVSDLLGKRELEKVKGGTGGVYLLRDPEEKPKYVIKPGDEAILTINNGKKNASPFFYEDNVCVPKGGVDAYLGPENSECADYLAKVLQFQDITPETEIMIIEDPNFHDALDGTVEKESKAAEEMEESLPTTREKVCSVQKYIEDCWDMGTYLAIQATIEPSEIKKLIEDNPEAYQILEDLHTPRDIDQRRYEQIAIFEFLIGEKDGNSGNFLCAQKPSPDGTRLLYKIDNACTFPEDNKGLNSGLEWVAHNFKLSISPEGKEIVRGIKQEQIDSIKAFMRTRRKSEASIQAFEERVSYLKEYIEVVDTIEQLTTAFDYIAEEEEEKV